MKRTGLFLICLSLTLPLLFSACKNPSVKGQATENIVCFDTSVTITVYGDRAEEALEEAVALCRELELVFSAQNKDSELYKINHRDVEADGSAAVSVSPELAEAIALGLEAWDDTLGLFDITILPVSSLWDFRSGKGTVPDGYLLREELLRVNSAQVSLSGTTLTLTNRNTEIDLGAIAKGCISKALNQFLSEKEGVTGAILNLGGNISVVGEKPDGTPWQIGIQKPFASRGELIATVSIREGCIISSGTYERNFTEKGIFYHHILSAKDGLPVDSGLSQATVIGTDDALADTLSTVCMLLGREESEALIEEKGYDVRILYTLEDGSLILFEPGAGEQELTEGAALDFS